MLIEIESFHLVEGVSDDEFLELDARVQVGFAYQQPGLLRRTTARGHDSRWYVLTLWGSLDDADAAAAARTGDETAARMDALIDRATATRTLCETLD